MLIVVFSSCIYFFEHSCLSAGATEHWLDSCDLFDFVTELCVVLHVNSASFQDRGRL